MKNAIEEKYVIYDYYPTDLEKYEYLYIENINSKKIRWVMHVEEAFLFENENEAADFIFKHELVGAQQIKVRFLPQNIR